MNPTQKQFSLNRAASRKQFPISFNQELGGYWQNINTWDPFAVCQFLIIALIALFNTEVLAQNGNGVIVKGKLDVRFYVTPGTLQGDMSSSNTFCATIGRDHKWSLEVRPIYEPGNIMYGKEDLYFLTFDGSDSYFCHYTEAVEGLVKNRPAIVSTLPIKDKDQKAYISTGSYPYAPGDAQRRTHILWLAFLSGIEMQESKTNMPLPWIPARWNMMAYGFRWDCQMTEQFPFAPATISFVRDVHLDLANIEEEFRRPELNNANSDEWFASWKEQIAQRNRWENGMVAGALISSDFTNRSGVNIPRKSTLAVYVPKSKTSDKTRRLYSVEVDSVADLSDEKISHPPLMGKKTSVDDSRFRSTSSTHKTDEIYYNLSGANTWKSKDDPQLEALFRSFQRAKHTDKIEPGHYGRKRFITVLCFLGAALSSALFLCWITLGKKDNKRQPTKEGN